MGGKEESKPSGPFVLLLPSSRGITLPFEDARPGFQAFGNLLSVCFKPVCLTWSAIYCQFEGFLFLVLKNRTSPGGASVLKSPYFSRYTCMFSQR